MAEQRTIPELIEALGIDSDSELRAAQDALIAVGEPAVEPLLAAFDHPSWRVRLNAAQTAPKIDRNLLDRLSPRLATCSVLFYQYAMIALGELNDPRVLSYLGDALGHQQLEVRTAAIGAVGSYLVRRRDSDSLQLIVNCLLHVDRHVRTVAEYWLVAFDVEIAQTVLIALATESEFPEIRQSSLNALGRLGAERAVATVLGGLLDAEFSVRAEARRAAELLASRYEVPSPEAYLIALLHDHDPQVRAMAVNTLNYFKIEQAIDTLIELLEIDLDADVRVQAILALKEFGDMRAFKPLVFALRDVYESSLGEVRVFALSALARIGGERAVEPLIQVFEEGFYEAARELGQIGTPAATEVLINALQKGIPEAASALRRTTDPRGAKALINALGDPQATRDLRINAYFALEERKEPEAIRAVKVFQRSDEYKELHESLGAI